MTLQRCESPVRRVNPSGKVVWKARYTSPNGERVSAGTFKTQRQAQDAINAAYDAPALPRAPDTVGAYLETWIRRYPRAKRTNITNESRIRQLLDVKVEGRRFERWPLRELRRRHALELVDHMLRKQGRATNGAKNILRSLSAMTEDAITDELCDLNPFKGVRVRGNDQRARKQPEPVRVFSWEQMHALAIAAGRHEAMIRVLSDCGLRVGELFALQRADLDLPGGLLRVKGSAWEGEIIGSTREKNHDRALPLGPDLIAVLRQQPPRIDTPWLFPTSTGKTWRYNNWRRAVWNPAVKAAGFDIRPHEMRHSWESLLAAEGVDVADLAEMAGHSVATMQTRYVHALERSFEKVRNIIG